MLRDGCGRLRRKRTDVDLTQTLGRSGETA